LNSNISLSNTWTSIDQLLESFICKQWHRIA